MSEDEIKQYLAKYGWKLHHVRRCKDHDNLVVENFDLRLTAHMRGHIEDFPVEALKEILRP